MATTKLTAELDVQDKASGKIQQFGLSLGKLSAAVGIGTIAADAFAKATGFVTDTIKGSIAAAQAEQVANVKVNAILKTLTGSMQEHEQAVSDASRAAMKLGFDDEDAAISMAKLLQVTGNTTQAQTALQNAMDLARFKGIDLETATNAVNMAMQGNVKILKQLGIEIPDNASKMELMGLIHAKVAGQAEAYGSTAAGAQEKFKVAMENLQETIGGKLLPIMTKMFGNIADFVNGDKLKSWLDTIGNLFNTYIAPVIRNYVIPAFNSLKASIEPHIPLIQNIFKIIGIGVGATLVGAMIVLSEIIKIVGKGFDIVATSIENVIKWIKEAIGWFDKIIGKVSSFAGGVGKVVGGSTNAVSDFFKGIFKAEGGAVSAGRPYIVGEQGAEMFVPSTSGTIIPNNKLGAGGTVTVNFNNPVVRDESDMRRLVDEVQRAITEAGRLTTIGAI